VHIQESKASTCDIQPGRRPTGPDLLRFVEEYRSRAGITVQTSNVLRNETDAAFDSTREEEGS
jgi:formate dehydrogenase major subunit